MILFIFNITVIISIIGSAFSIHIRYFLDFGGGNLIIILGFIFFFFLQEDYRVLEHFLPTTTRGW